MNAKFRHVTGLFLHRSSLIVGVAAGAAIMIGAAHSPRALACPFCLAIEPTLAQRRESAAVVALGEAADRADGEKSQAFRLHTVFKGPHDLKRRNLIDADSPPAKTGTLAILFATPDDNKDRADRWDWNTAFANEALLGYFAAAPDLRQPTEKRLAYFVSYLEHADRDIARDAYLEFAHAPYEDVLAVADTFDYARVRRWLVSQRVPDERKGFYGLVLGMANRDTNRADNVALLKRMILEDRSDFRAGFDGMLAGYLLLNGEDGLKLLTSRYLTNQKAKHGDVRHVMSALRFYYEYGPKDHRDAVARGVAPLVDRPEFAAAAITDLARWEHWEALDSIAAVYRDLQSDGPTRRAVVGFLRACPEPEAVTILDRFRQQDPTGVEAAEKSLAATAGKRSSFGSD